MFEKIEIRKVYYNLNYMYMFKKFNYKIKFLFQN